MCELKVVLVSEGTKSVVMESVTRMIVDGDSIHLNGLLGDREVVKGSIKEIDFGTGEAIIIQG